MSICSSVRKGAMTAMVVCIDFARNGILAVFSFCGFAALL
jgi:hypothetical protein